jgi:hypothetical protein
MATTIIKSSNGLLLKIKTGSDLDKCYSLTSGFKFAPKSNSPEAIIFTIGGETFDMICANGITVNVTNYTTLANAHAALVSYLG